MKGQQVSSHLFLHLFFLHFFLLHFLHFFLGSLSSRPAHGSSGADGGADGGGGASHRSHAHAPPASHPHMLAPNIFPPRPAPPINLINLGGLGGNRQAELAVPMCRVAPLLDDARDLERVRPSPSEQGGPAALSVAEGERLADFDFVTEARHEIVDVARPVCASVRGVLQIGPGARLDLVVRGELAG